MTESRYSMLLVKNTAVDFDGQTASLCEAADAIYPALSSGMPGIFATRQALCDVSTISANFAWKKFLNSYSAAARVSPEEIQNAFDERLAWLGKRLAAAAGLAPGRRTQRPNILRQADTALNCRDAARHVGVGDGDFQLDANG